MVKIDKIIEVIDEFKDEKGLPPYFESQDLAERIWDVIKEEERKAALNKKVTEASR